VETAGVIVLVVFLVFMTLAVVATVKTVRAVKRGVSRGGAQARRVMEDQRLKARRFTVPGPAGELVRLRLELRASIDSTYRALEVGHGEDASLTEAAGLLSRLSDHAGALDGELKLLEQEPDRARIADRLPGLAERARRITHSADALRWAAQDRARRFADDDLSALTRDVDLEAGALRHWTPVDPGVSGGPGVSGVQGAQGVRRGPGSPGVSGKGGPAGATGSAGAPKLSPSGD
jgi:hypothetical protein